VGRGWLNLILTAGKGAKPAIERYKPAGHTDNHLRQKSQQAEASIEHRGRELPLTCGSYLNRAAQSGG
jgi:hypothetical protein